MTDSRLSLHHIGCLVSSMDEGVASYASLGYSATGEAVVIASQKVRVLFLSTGTGPYVELVEPAADNGFLQRTLNKGINFYHLGFLCSDLASTLEQMTNEGGRILNRFFSEAFEGRECVFILTKLGQMIELIQDVLPADGHAA